MKGKFREQDVIQRQGRDMVLYSGLLHVAHEEGLVGIETELLQVPKEENGWVAIAKAKVFMEGDRTFDGIGDAGPHNVGKMIAPHTIRMSETRAKARALRDAIDVSEALMDDVTTTSDEAHEDAPQGPETISVRGSGDLVTQEQLKTMKNLAIAARWEPKKIEVALDKWGWYKEQAGEDVIANLEKEAGLKKDAAEISGK